MEGAITHTSAVGAGTKLSERKPSREIASDIIERPRFYNFDSTAVRVVGTAQEPWFVAHDVCAALGISNSRQALASLEDDEKGVSITDTLGGPQELATVNESGLYALIFRSRKPQARLFRKWVTSEVLPAIRKTGTYTAPVAALTEQVSPPLPRVADLQSTGFFYLCTPGKRIKRDLMGQQISELLAVAVDYRMDWHGTIADLARLCVQHRMLFWLVQDADNAHDRAKLARALHQRIHTLYRGPCMSKLQLDVVGESTPRTYIIRKVGHWSS